MEKISEQTRKSLVRSLEAVATLPWQSAIASWGNPEQSYTTDGTSIAVWNLDARLAKSLGNWPILVGLNTEDETWEVAAFRFDALMARHFLSIMLNHVSYTEGKRSLSMQSLKVQLCS